MRDFLAAPMLCLALGMLVISTAQARDDGRYAGNPLKQWFDSLASKHGLCCSMADGLKIDDPDWRLHGARYQVKLGGEWLDVPPESLVTENNKVGFAIVWPVKDAAGKYFIRCFMPGSGA